MSYVGKNYIYYHLRVLNRLVSASGCVLNGQRYCIDLAYSRR